MSAPPRARSVQLYVDPISESSRATVVLCRLLHLPVEVKWISIKRGEHRTSELMAANPLGKVPFLLDDALCVPEACAILTYLARRFQAQVPDSWYPRSLHAHTVVDTALYWQQRTLRLHTDKLLSERVLKPAAGSRPLSGPTGDTITDAERGVLDALSQLENVWLLPRQPVPRAPAAPTSSESHHGAAAAIAGNGALVGNTVAARAKPREPEDFDVGGIATPAPFAAPATADRRAPACDGVAAAAPAAAASGAAGPSAVAAAAAGGASSTPAPAPAVRQPVSGVSASAPASGPPAAEPQEVCFMGGGLSPSLCDLLCACIIEQLRLLDVDTGTGARRRPDYADVLARFPRVRAWLARVDAECRPHFGDVHAPLRASVARAQGLAAAAAASTGAGPGAAAAALRVLANGAVATGPTPAGAAVASAAHTPAAAGSAPAPAAVPQPIGMRGGPPPVDAAALAGGSIMPPPALSVASMAGSATSQAASPGARPPAGGPLAALPASSAAAGAVSPMPLSLGRPTFTPSFPSLPNASLGSANPSAPATLHAIFNGVPPAALAATQAGRKQPAAGGPSAGSKGGLMRTGSVSHSAQHGSSVRSTGGGPSEAPRSAQ